MNTPEATPTEQAAEKPVLLRGWRPWAIGGAVLLGGWFLFGRGGKKDPAVNAAGRPVPVAVAVAWKGDMAVHLTGLGTVTALNSVTVKSRVDGQLVRIAFTEGQMVREGDLLAEIDPRPFQVQLMQAEGQYAKNQAAFQNATADLRRLQGLVQQGIISRQQLDTQSSAVAQFEAALKSDQAQVESAKLNLGYTRITAPMDGTVVAIPVEEGQTVNANQTTPTIVQVADLSTMLNKMQIAEGDVNKVKAGMKLTFTTLSQPDNVREATLESIDPGLTTMSQGSYTTSTDTTDSAIYYYARSLVPNEDNVLHIGMTTENTITINQAEKVLAVPKLAVKQRGGKQYVRVLGENNQPQEKEITTGLSDNMNTEVKSGLGEGENVIISEAAAGETSDSVGRGMGRPPM